MLPILCSQSSNLNLAYSRSINWIVRLSVTLLVCWQNIFVSRSSHHSCQDPKWLFRFSTCQSNWQAFLRLVVWLPPRLTVWFQSCPPHKTRTRIHHNEISSTVKQWHPWTSKTGRLNNHWTTAISFSPWRAYLKSLVITENSPFRCCHRLASL